MEDKISNQDENANSDKGSIRHSFTHEEIKQHARDFCDKWLLKSEKHCEICKGRNCNNNDTCIHCGCQF